MSPRYYFHLGYRDRFYRDEEGDELPDEGAARAHARATARDLIQTTRAETIRDWFDCAFEVADENGRTVLVLPFGETDEGD